MVRNSGIRWYSQARLSNPCGDPLHIPVMAAEVLHNLQPRQNGIYIDMTFGAGGHTRQILEAASGVKVVALDRDEDAHALALELKDEYPDQVIPVLGRFSGLFYNFRFFRYIFKLSIFLDLPSLLAQHRIEPGSVDGMLFDFGCSSMQFDQAERGFAISKNGPLDMRMDKNRIPDQPSAADVLARIDESDLARILKVYGEEKNAKKIARAIVDVRYSLRKLTTTKELADLITSCFIDDARSVDKIGRPSHLATKTFQALRIFVNDELNEINYGMLLAAHYLKQTGRLVTITFHSLEDTIVKRHLMGHLMSGGTTANPVPLKYCAHAVVEDEKDMSVLMASHWYQIHKHVLVPNAEEVDRNPRSRSAKLRAAIRV